MFSLLASDFCFLYLCRFFSVFSVFSCNVYSNYFALYYSGMLTSVTISSTGVPKPEVTTAPPLFAIFDSLSSFEDSSFVCLCNIKLMSSNYLEKSWLTTFSPGRFPKVSTV